jgi:hypothetical protein
MFFKEPIELLEEPGVSQAQDLKCVCETVSSPSHRPSGVSDMQTRTPHHTLIASLLDGTTIRVAATHDEMAPPFGQGQAFPKRRSVLNAWESPPGGH